MTSKSNTVIKVKFFFPEFVRGIIRFSRTKRFIINFITNLGEFERIL